VDHTPITVLALGACSDLLQVLTTGTSPGPSVTWWAVKDAMQSSSGALGEVRCGEGVSKGEGGMVEKHPVGGTSM
jgi:hypothetical protein